jgi:hypothetical protein
VCTFEVDFDKNISCTDYSLNSTYVQSQNSLFFETESGGIGTFYIAPTAIIYALQEQQTGNFSASIINATIGRDLLVEISSTNNEVHIIEIPVSGSTTVVINQDIDQYFNASAALSVRIWQQDATGNKYVKTIDPVTYESASFNFVK